MADDDDMIPEFPVDLKIENIEVQNPPETGIIQSYGSIEPPPDFVRPDDDEEIEDDEDPDDDDAFSNNSSDDDSDVSDEKSANEDIEMEDAKTNPQDDQEARLNLLAQVQHDLEVLVLIKRVQLIRQQLYNLLQLLQFLDSLKGL